MHPDAVRRSIIHPFRTPADGAEQFPVIFGRGMGACPSFADTSIVEIFAGKGLFGNAVITGHFRDRLNQRPKKLQGIIFDIVGKFDKTAFLEGIEQCFHED